MKRGCLILLALTLTMFLGCAPKPPTPSSPARTPTTTAITNTSNTTLAHLLATYYGTCQTSLGPTTFTFTINENNSIASPYDYWIQVEYDLVFFTNVRYNNRITMDMNCKVSEELKNHQERLAKSAIAVMPGKKFYGGYYHASYDYPSLKIGWQSTSYCTWVNYAPASFSGSYDKAILSDFAWFPLIDNNLSR